MKGCGGRPADCRGGDRTPSLVTIFKNGQWKDETSTATYNLMALHHVVKLLVDPLVLLLGGWSEDVGAIGVRAVAAPVLLLVQGLKQTQAQRSRIQNVQNPKRLSSNIRVFGLSSS